MRRPHQNTATVFPCQPMHVAISETNNALIRNASVWLFSGTVSHSDKAFCCSCLLSNIQIKGFISMQLLHLLRKQQRFIHWEGRWCCIFWSATLVACANHSSSAFVNGIIVDLSYRRTVTEQNRWYTEVLWFSFQYMHSIYWARLWWSFTARQTFVTYCTLLMLLQSIRGQWTRFKSYMFSW